jgi:hypothetical protein
VCSTAVIIDNAIFVGDLEQCAADAAEFVARCKEVGCTLNEDTSDIRSMIKTYQEWGGIGINLEEKTTKLTSKFVDKLRLSWSVYPQWSRRSFAVHMGLLFWAVGIVVADPGNYFPVLKHYASVCRDFSTFFQMSSKAAQDRFWAEPAAIPPDVFKELELWTNQVLKNVPRFVHSKNSGLPDWLVCVDACRFGFGYVALNPRTGETRVHGQRWPREFAAKYRNLLHRSVFTEPHGVKMSMCHLLNHTGEKQHVHIWTDSVTTMTSGNKGYNSRSELVNQCLTDLKKLFPTELYTFTFQHIAGASNTVADAKSRGRQVSFQDVEGAAAHMLAMFGGEAADHEPSSAGR